MKSNVAKRTQSALKILDDAAIDHISGGLAAARPTPIPGPHWLKPPETIDLGPRFEPPVVGTELS